MPHLPSGRFGANSAWLVVATIAFNLTRAAGTLASEFGQGEHHQIRRRLSPRGPRW